MKVVLFCGGLGLRLRDYSTDLPKPLVEVGHRPVLWHLMKYYAHYGHKDFVLCLGYGQAAIKNYFLKYEECASNDFVLSDGGRSVELFNRDLGDWRITFVDTGINSNVGERLRRVRPHLKGEELFLANYADGLSDLDTGAYVEAFKKTGKIGCFVSVRVPHSYHVVHADEQHHAQKLEHVGDAPIRINGGFFAFRQEIFEYMREGEELVVEPFARLIEKRQLLAVPHDGFWRGMDTSKDRSELELLLSRGSAPWQVWAK
ncbi:MAG TPA: sugar phosphate nucleotidyltransferase [Polyangiaceae bacterium]|nr:sugar phosphate nucleotidyltransferase [Polyangiaceae bacterium]